MLVRSAVYLADGSDSNGLQSVASLSISRSTSIAENT
ncbi:uncharacterized protein METZ01_LOCUS418401 [marine metagenome]|uniref:Uncharacterized protein n=1 Tax=marine metagenome TaxID=408172 RepID=A0A382X2W3_9ZZZZ